jgi:hypothetical protein
MLYRSKIFWTGLQRGMIFTAVAFGLAQVALAVSPTTTVSPLILSGRQSDRPAGTYSTVITDIIKMLDAKVDAPVILAYIQNSPIPYNPDATELIALKEHGASTETLVALLHRGDELRLLLAQTQSAANAAPSAPAFDYPPAAVNPPYPSGNPDASYAPYPATDYSYGWPLAYWPSVRIGAYRPYGYAHGRFYAPSGGHNNSPVVHSGGSRGSGRSGGRSGGRSR